MFFFKYVLKESLICKIFARQERLNRALAPDVQVSLIPSVCMVRYLQIELRPCTMTPVKRVAFKAST